MSAPTSPRKTHSSHFLYLQLHTKSLNFFFTTFMRFREIAKSSYKLLHVYLSVCPQGKSRLQIDEFLWHFMH
jgi:hypothetical protein